MAEQWAAALGLSEVEPYPGTVRFAGLVGGCRVTVWGVVDRDVFERPMVAADVKLKGA